MTLFSTPTESISEIDPQHYGVPHKRFRKAQWDAIQKSELVLENPNKKFIFAEAPTGVGKSAIATALGASEPVTVFVGTLNLLDQYQREYGFAGVKGRQNYPCILPDKVEMWELQKGRQPTAHDCHFTKMWDCPMAGACPYLVAKSTAIKARRTVVTYAYGALSRSIAERRGILVCDEGHGSAEHILGFASFSIDEKYRKKYNLPQFPAMLNKFGERGQGALMDQIAHDIVLDWLADCREEIRNQMAFLPPLTEEYAQLQKVHDRFLRQINSLDQSVWFLECRNNLFWGWSNGGRYPMAGLKLRPLDARSVARGFWREKDMVLIMSATIGDPSPLADKLGINMETAEHHVYPHPVPVHYRPIHDLNIKRMTYRNLKKHPNLYQVQAVAIANFINELSPEWRGIVLTSSYKKISELSKRLREFLPDQRRIITQQTGMRIDGLTQQFIEDDREDGDVLVASIQGFGEGIDLRADLARFAVVAGVPFDNPTDPYTNALRSQAGGQKYLLMKTYATIPQACGRVTRATKEENGEWRLNVAAVADGSTTTGIAKKYYPKFFREALEITNEPP